METVQTQFPTWQKSSLVLVEVELEAQISEQNALVLAPLFDSSVPSVP